MGSSTRRSSEELNRSTAVRPVPVELLDAMSEDETTVRRAPALRVEALASAARDLEARLRERDARIAALEATLARLEREIGAVRASPVTPLPESGPLGSFRAPLSEPPPLVLSRPPRARPADRTVIVATFAICGAVLCVCAATIVWAVRDVLGHPRPSSVAALDAPERATSSPHPRSDRGRAPVAAVSAAATSASVAPPNEAARVEAAPPAPVAAELLSYQGVLVVRSSIDADVFVNGVRAGATNTPLVARCGLRNVRAATPHRAWIAPSQVVRIACRGVTEITTEPAR